MSDHAKSFTVVASYADPPSLYCTTVEADTPETAVEAAWEQCADDNGWATKDSEHEYGALMSDHWTDTMVIAGPVEVVL